MREARRAAAEALRGRWGCRDGTEAATALPPPLATAERAACARMGTTPQGSCPLRAVYHPDPYTLEVLDAWPAVKEGGLPWPEALGRPLAAVDAQCIGTLVQADAARQRMDFAWRKEHPNDPEDDV